MKAIATLAVLGLAYAGERKENTRFRIGTTTLTANNNKDVLNIDFSKDMTNIPGVKTSVVTQDLKDILPSGLRHLIKDVKVDHQVFTAQNNTGVITINMADDELFLDLTNKHTHVNADHNSGMMNIRVNNDDADNELVNLSVLNRKIQPWEIQEIAPMYKPKFDDADNELIGVTWKNKDINGSHNSGRMDININNDDADNEFSIIANPKPQSWQFNPYTPYKNPLIIEHDSDNELRSRTTVHANDNNGMMMVMGNDDELFLDLTNKHTHVNADHNSGMMNINVNNDDELMMVPRWRNDIRRPVATAEADDELFLDFTNKHTHVDANHNSGMMNVNVHNSDDELFLDFTNKHTHVNANHNSGMMNINVHNSDDADNELMQLGALLRSLRDKTN